MQGLPKRVGPFRIEAPLGEGGTSQVFRAVRDGARAPVALKVLRAGCSRRDRERFVREANLTRELEDPHLVHVVDADLEANRPWIAMDLVSGEDLAKLMHRDRARVERLAPRICTGLLEALVALEGVGLTHRDVTPANVLLTERDEVLLVDMGLLSEPGPGTTGTYSYAPPEALRGSRQGTPSDVYQVAAVVYEILSGMVPNEDLGGNYLDDRRDGEPPGLLAEVTPGASGAVSTLLDQMLDPDPAARPSVKVALRKAREIPAPWSYPAAGPGPGDDEPRVPWRFGRRRGSSRHRRPRVRMRPEWSLPIGATPGGVATVVTLFFLAMGAQLLDLF